MAYTISGIGATGGQVESQPMEAAVIPDTRQHLAPSITQFLDADADATRGQITHLLHF